MSKIKATVNENGKIVQSGLIYIRLKLV